MPHKYMWWFKWNFLLLDSLKNSPTGRPVSSLFGLRTPRVPYHKDEMEKRRCEVSFPWTQRWKKWIELYYSSLGSQAGLLNTIYPFASSPNNSVGCQPGINSWVLYISPFQISVPSEIFFSPFDFNFFLFTGKSSDVCFPFCISEHQVPLGI